MHLKKLIGRIWGDRLVAREVVGLKMMLFLMFKYHLYEYECISGLTWYPKTMAQSGQYSSPNGSRSLQVSVFHVISSNLCLHVPNMVHVSSMIFLSLNSERRVSSGSMTWGSKPMSLVGTCNNHEVQISSPWESSKWWTTSKWLSVQMGSNNGWSQALLRSSRDFLHPQHQTP